MNSLKNTPKNDQKSKSQKSTEIELEAKKDSS